MIKKETEEKKKYNEALREKKKYCLLPSGLPAKVNSKHMPVLIFRFNQKSFNIFTQSFEYVSLKDDENEGIATPLHGTPILVFYNNIEISDQVDYQNYQV